MRALLLLAFLCGATIISGRVVKLAKLSDCQNGSDDEPCSNTEVYRPPPKKCEKCGFYIEVEADEAPEPVAEAQEQLNIKSTDGDFLSSSTSPEFSEQKISVAPCKHDDTEHNEPQLCGPVLLPVPANTPPPPTPPQRPIYETKYDIPQKFEDQRYDGNFPSPPELPPLNLRHVFENIQPHVPIEPANELHYPSTSPPFFPTERPTFSHPCEQKPHLPCHSSLLPTAEQSQPCSPEFTKPCYYPIIPTQPTKPLPYEFPPNRLPYEWQRENFNLQPVNIPPPPQLPHLDLKTFFFKVKLPQVTPEPELPATYVPPYIPPVTLTPITLLPTKPTEQPIYIPNKNEEHKPEYQGQSDPCTLVLYLKKKCRPHFNKN